MHGCGSLIDFYASKIKLGNSMSSAGFEKGNKIIIYTNACLIEYSKVGGAYLAWHQSLRFLQS